MRPASPVYSTSWSPGHPSVPPPPPAVLGQLPDQLRKRYYTLAEWVRMKGMRGLGQLSPMQTVALSAPAIAGGVAAIAWSSLAIPVIGPIVAGVTLGLSALFARKGPRQKVATTTVVDKIEPLLVENLNGYLAGPRNVTSQQQALANFDAGWQYVLQGCGIPEMGDPGERCISERQAGGQWDWFARYRDPIAGDPNVRPDPVVDSATGQLVDSLTGGAFSIGGLGLGSGTLLLGLALLAGAFLIGGGK